MAAPQITTPKPPLNLFKVQRIALTDAWTPLYEVPEYLIPANGPNPEQVVETTAILTVLMVGHDGASLRTISVRITDEGGGVWLVAHEIDLYPNDVTFLNLDRQILQVGDKIEAIMGTGQTATAHLSFILNTREIYEVVA